MRDRKSTRLNSSHTEIYTLSLHDALPIYVRWPQGPITAVACGLLHDKDVTNLADRYGVLIRDARSEEHTSELQSHRDLHSFPTRRSSDLRQMAPRADHRGGLRPAPRQGCDEPGRPLRRPHSGC